MLKNLRLWWRKPRRFGDHEGERKVTFLELFYDLVYVVLISQLSHKLAEDVSVAGVGKFVFLYLIVWWSWLNGAMYHDLHGNNDVKTRVITFAQMICAVAMAVFIHDALGHGSIGFSISWTLFLLVITSLWWRSGYHDPEHRPLSNPYTIVFSLAVILTGASVLVDEALRAYLWGIALAFVMLVPLGIFVAGKRHPKMRKQIEKSSRITESLVERFGLMTIIVLGEVIVGVTQGIVRHEHKSLMLYLTAFMSMLLAIGIWWLYFDFISSHMPKNNLLSESSWVYLHMPITMGIAATGASVLNILASPDTVTLATRALLIGSVVTVYLAVFLAFFVISTPSEFSSAYRWGQWVTLAAAILTGGLLLMPIRILPLLVILNVVMLAPVYCGFRAWLAAVAAVTEPPLAVPPASHEDY